MRTFIICLWCTHLEQFTRNIKLEGLELILGGDLQHYQHKAGIGGFHAAAEACEPGNFTALVIADFSGTCFGGYLYGVHLEGTACTVQVMIHNILKVGNHYIQRGLVYRPCFPRLGHGGGNGIVGYALGLA